MAVLVFLPLLFFVGCLVLLGVTSCGGLVEWLGATTGVRCCLLRAGLGVSQLVIFSTNILLLALVFLLAQLVGMAGSAALRELVHVTLALQMLLWVA